MSPLGTSQPSGTSPPESGRQREEDRMVLDPEAEQEIAQMMGLDSEELAQEYGHNLPERNRDMVDDDEEVSEPPPPASAILGEPLSSVPAMIAALSGIEAGDPTSMTVRRGGRRPAPQYDDPVVRLRQQVAQSDKARLQVELANKAEAERAAATGQASTSRPDKRSRPASISHPLASGKKVRVNFPAADPNAMDTTGAAPANIRPTRFDNLHKQKCRCAVRIGSSPIMGNPFSQTSGWQLKVDLDPGVLAQPSVGLDFKFSKDGSDRKSNDHYNSFGVGWEPGVKIGGQWMMDNFIHFKAASPPTPGLLEHALPPAIKQLCKKPEDLDRLCCIFFKSNIHKSSEMSPEWAKALRGDDWEAPHANLTRMFASEDPSYNVYIWLMNPKSTFDYINEICLAPLRAAVDDHTPPFHQYLDENDEPMIDFNNLQTIAKIGNGMYVQRPKITDKQGKKAENRWGKISYFNLPKTTTWDSIKTFHITYGVPIVREAQYNEGLHAPLQRGSHCVFLQRMPALNVDGQSLQPSPAMKYTFWAGVRLRRDPKTGMKDAIPPVGTTIVVNFMNKGKGRSQGRIEDEQDQPCFARVHNYGGRAWLEKTRTDFCMLLTKPRRSKQDVWSVNEPKSMPDASLNLANLQVKVNLTPALREKKAFRQFCDETFAPELLDQIRLAFWSIPNLAPRVTDLTMGPAHSRSEDNKVKYNKILEALKVARKSNKSQDAVLMAASHMQANMVAVQGPPGAGKTRTLGDKIIALTKIGHKTLCVASSNVAVDIDAMAVWNALSPEERKVYKCLRLETDGAERAQRLAKAGYADYTGEDGEADKMPEYKEADKANDNPVIRNALDRISLQFALREEYAREILEKYDDVNKAYEATQEHDTMKRANVAVGMTLDYRIWEITREDRQKAEADYKEARAKLSSEEFQKLRDSGKFSVDDYDLSTKYRSCIANYVSKSGKVTKAERTALEDESDAIITRVLAETHILFTTASNCGGTLLEDSRSFVPTLIFCDETGQISIPSLSVPLTTFDKWEALFLFGDIQQLEPTVLSGQFNEFALNAKVSPLALLAMKGFPSYLLEEQYRMCPSCSLFPRKQFYDNKGLKDSPMIKKDNDIRKAMHQYTLDLGARGDKGQGTEYVITDVPNGCSRVELNGTSLVNHANADVIVQIIGRLLKGGVITANMITILSYYQGQRRLLWRQIQKTDWSQADKDAIDLSTVDAYQGNQAKIVIVDMVAAKDSATNGPPTSDENTADDAEDAGGEDYIKVGTVTAHVRSPNRLNVALTRGQDGVIVVCQAGLLSNTIRKERGKQSNALTNMIGDARGRNCILENYTEDMHPTSVRIRAGLGQKKVDDGRRVQRIDDLTLISASMNNWRNTKQSPAIPLGQKVKYYRTRGGHTTRPIGNRVIAAEADAFDKEVERAKEASLQSLEHDAELGQAIQASLEYPGLPRLDASDNDPQAMDTTGAKEHDTDSDRSRGFQDPPES